MSDVTPARIGLLIDYVDDEGGFDENILPSLQLVADEYVEQGVLERPVEFVVRAVQGLPTAPSAQSGTRSSNWSSRIRSSSSARGLRERCRPAPVRRGRGRGRLHHDGGNRNHARADPVRQAVRATTDWSTRLECCGGVPRWHPTDLTQCVVDAGNAEPEPDMHNGVRFVAASVAIAVCFSACSCGMGTSSMMRRPASSQATLVVRKYSVPMREFFECDAYRAAASYAATVAMMIGSLPSTRQAARKPSRRRAQRGGPTVSRPVRSAPWPQAGVLLPGVLL